MRKYTNEDKGSKNMKYIKKKDPGRIYTSEDRQHLEWNKVNITDLYR